MRALGAALILTACLGAGCTYIWGKRRRIETLRRLLGALELMSGELSARITPLPELCSLLADRTEGETAAFFKTLSASLGQLGGTEFSLLWRTAADKCLGGLMPDELFAFKCLGDSLGRYALDEQLSALSGCRSALGRGAEQARESYPNQRRLGLGLTATAGILLIIALI